MTTSHDPERGHFVIDYGDGFEMTGVDLGRVIALSWTTGKQQIGSMTPDQARELATALTTWADRTDAKPPMTHNGDITDCPACNDDEGRTVGEGARVLEEHMQRAMSQPDLFTEVTS